MAALNEFPDEYVKSFQTSVNMLKKINIRYLEDNRSFIKKYWKFCYIGPAMLVHLISMITIWAALLSKKQIFTVAQILPPFLISVHATLKGLVIIPKTTEISTIIRDLGNLWRTNYSEEQSREKDRLHLKLNLWNRVIYWAVLAGSIQFVVSPIMETLIRRYILQQDCELLLPVSAAYPFDPTQNWIIYSTIYYVQSYTLLILVHLYTGSELILITLSGLLANEFIMLKYDLARVTLSTNRRHGYDIQEFIKKHQKLIGLTRQLDHVFNQIVFIDLLFIGITTCAFRFAGTFARGLTYSFNNYIGVTNSLVTVFTVCYYGQQLTCASANLADVAYQSVWYKGTVQGTQYGMAIWFIIKISQEPRGLTSLGYAAVSLSTFSKVASTTWSYFSLLNSMYAVHEE